MSVETAAPISAATSRLSGVDGLRALAALWVVSYHMEVYSRFYFPQLPAIDLVVRNGFLGVSLFLVLSGFCLYVPFAGGKSGSFASRQFLWRRCKRLLPAYYASLVFALALAFVAGRLTGERMSLRDLIWQAFTHAALLHSLFPSTFYALNGAYWSLGLEWQLYLALPLLVVGVRAIGLARTMLLAGACNIAYLAGLELAIWHGVLRDQMLAGVVLPRQLFGRWSEFLLGMVAAELYRRGLAATWAARLRYPALLLVPVVFYFNHEPYTYLLSGAVFFVLLLHVLSANNVVARLASLRLLVSIGVMSYSLYLVHQPLIVSLSYLVRWRFHASPSVTFLALLAFVPFILVAAFVLFATVERYTLHSSGPIPPVRDFLPIPVRQLVKRMRARRLVAEVESV